MPANHTQLQNSQLQGLAASPTLHWPQDQDMSALCLLEKRALHPHYWADTNTGSLLHTFPGKTSLLKPELPRPTARLVPEQDLGQHLSGSPGPAAPSYSLRRQTRSQYLKGEANRTKKDVRADGFEWIWIKATQTACPPGRAWVCVCPSPRTGV